MICQISYQWISLSSLQSGLASIADQSGALMEIVDSLIARPALIMFWVNNLWSNIKLLLSVLFCQAGKMNHININVIYKELEN